jgi:serine protease Do
MLVSLGILIGLIVSAEWFPPMGGLEPPVSSAGPAPAEEPALSIPPGSQPFVGVARSVTPAVVNISTTRKIRAPRGQPNPFFNDPFFRQFFGDEFFRRFETPRQRSEQSLGSGVIVSADGYIVTNNHVVSKADEIKVLLNDRREFSGKVVGTDPKTDVAVIKITADGLPVIPWGDSDRLQVGEYVLAVGNPFGLNQTVTMGIISAVGRANVGIADYEDFIQTDAAINPGNSGGALVNAKGDLIGINTAIYSQSGGYMGIGFAVPSNMVRAVMDSLIATGKVVRGWLGVTIQPVTQDLAEQFDLSQTKGAIVGETMEGGPAEKAGLKPGDVIIRYNGNPVEDPNHLRNMVAQTPVGKKVKIELVRDKKAMTIEVTLVEQPRDMAEAGDGETAPAAADTALAGLEVRTLTPDLARKFGITRVDRGVVVTSVEPDSPSGQAGLHPGDVVLELNRRPVRDVEEYNKIAGRLDRDESVLLLVNRQGRNNFVVLNPAG